MPSTKAELRAAIEKYARLPGTDHNRKALARNWQLYDGRFGDEPDVEEPPMPPSPDWPLSSDIATARAQLLARSGAVGKANNPDEPTVLTFDPVEVYGASTPLARQELALLGVFGQPNAANAPLTDEDWTLFRKYYDEAAVGIRPDGQPTEGNWAPEEQYVNELWGKYLANEPDIEPN